MSDLFSRLDPDQLAAVRLRANGTVSAGAGSGKTTVLAARYLDLVLRSGADIRSILCLTFTRKAAAEMRARIWRELSNSGSEEARSQAARFSEASIGTIDSFCGSILRSSAQRYGYPPDFRVDDGAAARLAEAEALRFLLARREEPALRELLAYQGFMTVWKELFAGAGRRYATPVAAEGESLSEVPARARAALLRIVRESLGSIESARGEARELGALGTKTGEAFLAALAGLPEDLGSLLPSSAEDRAFLGALEEAGRRTGALADLGLRFGKVEGGPKEALRDAAEAAREAARRLRSCAEAARRRPLEEAVIGLLDEFAGLLAAAKREAGIMGFHDVVVATVDLLSSEPELRAWWKTRYRWIMVDEFQDDDELQKRLFFLLAEAPERRAPGHPRAAELSPDKLFFVGDDKQSIYRFRGADVAVFNRLGRELAEGLAAAGAAGGASEGPSTGPRLRRNYRSEPGLIAFFNRLFARVLAADPEADYEARFEETLAREPTPGVEAGVELHLADKGGGDEETRSADEALAEAMARRIEELVLSRSCLVPDGRGGPRPAEWEDVAILLRSSSKQYLVERFLRLHGIPHRAASMRSLFVEAPANDLFALLRLALLPSDRAALATFLRSPFARLSDGAFVKVLAAEQGLEASPEALDLGAQDRERLEGAKELLLELGARIDREPLASLLSWLWHERGLRLALVAEPSAQSFLEHFDWLFALAVAADREGESLAAFLDRVEPLLGSPDWIEEDIEVPREAGRGVQILTIHKSKGLEFPVVVLPWIENRGMGEQKGPSWYASREVGFSLNLKDWRDPKGKSSNLFYEEAAEEEGARALAETRRLFYVACTRASTRLVFMGLRPERLAEGSFLAFLGAKTGKEGELEGLPEELEPRSVAPLAEEAYRRLAARRGSLAPEALAPAYAAARALDRRAPGLLLSPTALSALAWERSPERLRPPPLLPSSGYDELADRVPEAAFGELCHALIEARLRKRELPPEAPALLALPEELRPPLLAEARRLAESFFASELGAGLDAAEELLVEKPLLLALGGRVLRARLDLALVREGEIIVIDWKSGRERIPGAYAVQLALYRRALALLYPGRRVRSFLWWLRAGEAEELAYEPPEEELLALAGEAARASLAGGGTPNLLGEGEERPEVGEIYPRGPSSGPFHDLY